MIPILSIVVPTKNRYYYLQFLAQYFHTIVSNKIELIIQDNSDMGTNENFVNFLNKINDQRISYSYCGENLTIDKNCDLAIKKAKGEYVTMIGDDDIFSKHIVKYVEKFKVENVDAILPIKSAYIWPDVNPRFYKNKLSGLYSVNDFKLKKTSIDIKKELEDVLNFGGVKILNLPRIYHGIIRRDILEKIYIETNSYFPGPSPDMANAVAICKYIDKYEMIDVPLIISGHSKTSGGGQGAQGQHYGEISKLSFLPKDTAANWDEDVPFYWSGSTIYAESVIQALKRTNRIDLIKKFNFEYLIANCFVFDTNYKDRIEKVYGSKNSSFKLKVKYYILLIWLKRINFHLINNLSLIILILKFNNIKRFKKDNILEVAFLNDEMIKNNQILIK